MWKQVQKGVVFMREISPRDIDKNAIQRIVLGPKCSIDKNQLTLFLSKYSPDVRRNNGIVKSNITYR